MAVALSDRYEPLPFFLLYLTIIEFRQQIYIYKADVCVCLSVCMLYKHVHISRSISLKLYTHVANLLNYVKTNDSISRIHEFSKK